MLWEDSSSLDRHISFLLPFSPLSCLCSIILGLSQTTDAINYIAEQNIVWPTAEGLQLHHIHKRFGFPHLTSTSDLTANSSQWLIWNKHSGVPNFLKVWRFLPCFMSLWWNFSSLVQFIILSWSSNSPFPSVLTLDHKPPLSSHTRNRLAFLMHLSASKHNKPSSP